MTNAMRPFLMNVETTDVDGQTSDTCSLTFDDSDGQVRLPKEGGKIKIYLQGVLVFEGVVDSVRSNGARGGGRTLRVGGKGFDSRGKAKEPQQFHKDDATLQEFLSEAAETAGFTIKVDPDLASIERDYWSAKGESFLHVGQKIARELNATFKIRGTQAVLAKRGSSPLPTVVGRAFSENANVINWSIAPITGRRKFKKARVKYFDREKAKFEFEDIEYSNDSGGAEAVNTIRAPVKDKDQAKAVGEARKSESEREGGGGTVRLDLAPEAQAEGLFQLIGARPGIDGTYRIVSVQHSASRTGGATTSLELKQPQDGAGKDSRQ